MAKTKQSTKKPEFDAVKIEGLGNELIGSRLNVYHVAKGMGIDTTDGDALFEALKAAGYAKCESCDYWLNASEVDEFDMCEECNNEQRLD